MQNDKITWESPEYIFREKSREWFIALGIIALALFVASILLKNFLFAIIITISTFTVILFAKRPPEHTLYEINKSGLIINTSFYPYSFLQSFWIDNTDQSWQKLLITSKKTLMPLIIIALGDQDPEEVKNFLANYLPEKEQYEPLSHKILEYLGF